jgi:hypothetical protein
MGKFRIWRFLAIMLIIIGFLILTEILSRVLISGYMRAGICYDKDLIWKYCGNLKIKVPGVIDFETNALGFRDINHKFTKDKNITRIAVIGGSNTDAILVEPKKIFTSILENRLNDKRIRFEVFNFGVPAYSTDQELIIFEKYALKYNPDIVVLVVDPNDIRESYRKKIYYMEDSTLKKNYDNTALKLSATDKLLWYLSTKSQAFYVIQQFFGFKYGTYQFIFDKLGGLSFEDKRYGIDEILLLREKTKELNESYNLFEHLIANFSEVSKRDNVTLLILYTPMRMEFDNKLDSNSFDNMAVQKTVTSICNKTGVPLINIYDDLYNNYTEVYREDGSHFNERGHELIANEMYKMLLETNLT